MKSSLSPSPEASSELLRRLREATRRTEIVANIATARTAGALAARLSEDLAKAYDAEVSFVLTRRSSSDRADPLAATGLDRAQLARLAESALLTEISRTHVARAHEGVDLLAIGARSV